MQRVITKIGDIFEVKIDDVSKKYFQYIANDMTMLNSDVIRAFKEIYALEADPNPSEIVNGEIDFFAHSSVNAGVKLNLWKKVVNVPFSGKVDALFRDPEDYGVRPGETPALISTKWRVWRINEPFKHVGKLEGENQKADVGFVVAPVNVVERLRAGKYSFYYPGY